MRKHAWVRIPPPPLEDINMSDASKYKIEVLTPCDYVAKIRDALNEAGACHVGKYDNCISYFPVSGFWRPLAGADPFAGKIGVINKGTECKLETVCDKKKLKAAIRAVKRVHPYEEPLIYVIPILDLDNI